MTIIVTLLAFIINVGLFVKAKINLQNATDAAAWAGAAVQARQLTNIGYLNWEMRNNYKEWMFKSYVLGQIALSTVKDTGITPNNSSPNNMQFRGKPFDPTNYPNEYEKFNLPTICIHFSDGHNICDLVRLPGLPRFNTVGLPSISAHHESVLSSLVDTKAKDCSRRTSVNFGAALLWAYGTGASGGLSFGQMPLIASSRIGAWVKGLELGLRMRNLEAQVNRPPVTNGICFSCGSGTNIGDIASNSVGNERPLKAFWSGFRNINGGRARLESQNDELGANFKLYELEPTPVVYGTKTLSNYLIPSSSVFGVDYNQDPNTKHYVDLQAYPLNLVSFFTTFISKTGVYNGTTTAQEADCGGSKTGMPVPGFMMGFVKNPEVMTYYAVRAETKFVGLFYPFADRNGVTINAYAAAKPFGGRVGPKHFQVNNNKFLTAREDAGSNRSGAYLSSITIPAAMQTAPLAEKYKPGTPIPLTDNFWVQNNGDAVGGIPDSGEVFFAIPNLLYDYTDEGDMDRQVDSLLNTFSQANSIVNSQSPFETKGLHSKNQFEPFKANFLGSTAPGSTIIPDDIEIGINRARRATKYDAANYLVPVIDDGEVEMETLSTIKIDPNCPFPPLSNPTPCFKLYAPLYGPGTLFDTPTATSTIIEETILQIRPAIQKFLDALKEVSESILAQGARDPGTYQAAADSIYKPGLLPGGVTDPLDPQCTGASIAQNFNHFFNGTAKACDITPIADLVVKYFNDQSTTFGIYHMAPIVTENDNPSNTLMTAYMPGTRQGADPDGSVSSKGPLVTGPPVSARRNFYSTKFVPLDRLMGGPEAYSRNGQWMFIERGLGSPPQDPAGSVKNGLSRTDLDLWDKLFF